MNKTKLILIGSACFSAGWAAPAWSQEAATPAQNAEAGGGAGLDEIVVTAQRREESLQKVALSASAFGAKALAEGNFRDIQALSVLTPSLQIINGYDPGRPSFAVRGQVQTNPTVSNDTSVGVYQDEVYLARSTGSSSICWMFPTFRS